MIKIRFFLSPFFLAKYYLLKDITNTLTRYKFAGNILDVGCGEKPYKSLFSEAASYKGIDFKNYSKNKDFTGEKPDYYFDDSYINELKLPFKNDSIDHVVSFQVLEHHRNPQKMIGEMSRITKPNGYILLTVPFLGGLHEVPNDYQRLTEYGLRELFQKYDCKLLEIKKQGSIFSTVSMLFDEYLSTFAAKDKIFYLISISIYPPFLVFQYISLFLDLIFNSEKIFFNYLVLAKKCRRTIK